MIQLGDAALGQSPCLVLAVRDTDAAASIATAISDGVQVLEYRVDLFVNESPGETATFLQQHGSVGKLLTVRGADEGGGWRRSEQERLQAYLGLLPHVHAIDIELHAVDIRDELISAAQEQEKLVICSHHNFSHTPSLSQLDDYAAEAYAEGADVFKLAAACDFDEDLKALAEFTLKWSPLHVITIGMGESAMLSRVFFPALGSLATYTFLGEATAPGQLTCAETVQYLHTFYPNWRRGRA